VIGRRVAVLALVVAVGSIACRQILGLTGESVVSDAGVDAGADTGPGDAGPDNDGDAAPPLIRCGQNLPTDAASFQSVVKACMLAVSCNPTGFASSGGDTERVSDCITSDTLGTYPEFHCLQTITDCAGYAACTGTMLATASQCPTATTPQYCSGSTAVTCGPAISVSNGVATDCTTQLAEGGCGTVETDAGPMSGCVVLDSCSDPNDGTYHCAGDILYTCFDGKGYGSNCAFFDSICAVDPTDPEAGPDCFDNGSACNDSGTTYCLNSTTAVACEGPNIAYFTNCAAAGLACLQDLENTSLTICLAPGCTFGQEATCAESCSKEEAGVANVCAGGAPFAFDCTTLGGAFSTCSTFVDPFLEVHAFCR
jgi:hypothetical protein